MRFYVPATICHVNALGTRCTSFFMFTFFFYFFESAREETWQRVWVTPLGKQSSTKRHRHTDAQQTVGRILIMTVKFCQVNFLITLNLGCPIPLTTDVIYEYLHIRFCIFISIKASDFFMLEIIMLISSFIHLFIHLAAVFLFAGWVFVPRWSATGSTRRAAARRHSTPFCTLCNSLATSSLTLFSFVLSLPYGLLVSVCVSAPLSEEVFQFL